MAERLSRAAAISGLAVLGSRVLGLVREQLFAFFFGASAAYDAFLTAFRVPNLWRDLLAEGALSSAFVTVFVKEEQNNGSARAFQVANVVLTAFGLLLIALVLLSIWQTPLIVHALASGFTGAKFALTVYLARLMLPFILFAFICAVMMGMLNAQGYYALPQSASSFFNITSIVVGLGLSWWWAPAYFSHFDQDIILPNQVQLSAAAMVAMAIGTVLGGFVQCLVQLPTLYRLGFHYTPTLQFNDPGFKSVVKLLLPALLGAAAVQLNVFINSNFASNLGDKAISWLNYAFRLIQFPIGIFGVALVSAWLPSLSRHQATRNQQGFYRTFSEGLQLVLFFSLPAASGLIVCSEPIVRLVYQHGRFVVADTIATAAAVTAYGVGLPGYAALKLLQPSFVTLGMPTMPMLVSLVGLALNFSLNLFLVGYVRSGHVGLALSTSAVSLSSTAVLLTRLLYCGAQNLPTDQRVHRALLAQIARMLLASSLMAAVCSLVYHTMQKHGFARSALQAFWELMVLLPLGIVVYGLAVIVFGVAIGWRFVRGISERIE